MRSHVLHAVFGFAMGFVVSQSGFTDWGEMHRMFTFGIFRGGPGLGDLRLMLAVLSCVALLMAAFFLFGRRDAIGERPFRVTTIPGGLIFGLGWALTGACPAAVVVQLGEGKAAAVATFCGMLAGTRLCRWIGAKQRWSIGTCGD
jgi:uncharacterized membrane protein YedE/YeeE